MDPLLTWLPIGLILAGEGLIAILQFRWLRGSDRIDQLEDKIQKLEDKVQKLSAILSPYEPD